MDSLLEYLPAELRYEILVLLGLDELSALVHASPIFHQDYVTYRKLILLKSIETTLGVIIKDVYATHETATLEFVLKRTGGIISQCLTDYKQQDDLAAVAKLRLLTENEIINCVNFYFATVSPLVQQYTSWALTNLAQQIQPLVSTEILSNTERLRILRAFYRLELGCNLFGVGKYKSARKPDNNGLFPEDVLELFFCLYKPWEVEEIDCVYTFAETMYAQIFDKVHVDVHPGDPPSDIYRIGVCIGPFELLDRCKLESIAGFINFCTV
jgi:hypothetical protein